MMQNPFNGIESSLRGTSGAPGTNPFNGIERTAGAWYWRSTVDYGILLTVSINNGGSLIIESKSGKRKMPIWEVDVVVVASSGVSLTSRALRLMIRSGVELLVLDSRGDPVGIMYSSYYTRTPETRRAQYLAVASGRAAYYMVSIAKCKIGSQASVLERLSVDFSEKRLRAHAEELRRDSTRSKGGCQANRCNITALDSNAY
jgi:CRISPR/Cas system-associated endonuclease Cas1